MLINNKIEIKNNGLLIIHPPVMSIGDGLTRISSNIEFPLGKEQLWYEVKSEYAHWISNETSDAFLVAILIYAMKNKFDVHVNGSISSKLFYNVNFYLMEIIRNLIPECSQVDISVDRLIRTNWGGVEVFTGFSAGVDSFCTVNEHLESNIPVEYRVTTLLLNNVGSHGQSIRDQDVFKERFARLEHVATKLDLPMFWINSNLDLVLKMDFQLTHTIRNVSVALLLQKGCSKYLYSSAVHYTDGSVRGTHDMGYADAVTLNLFSTETTECISSGGQYTRFRKTEIIADCLIAQKSLDVCVAPQNAAKINCSTCWKCLRTQLSLEIVGKLAEYSDVFEIDKYRSMRFIFICNVLTSSASLSIEIKLAMKKHGFAVPVRAKIVAFLLSNKMIEGVEKFYATHILTSIGFFAYFKIMVLKKIKTKIYRFRKK
ncbi:hypothetical protein QN362_16460 [Actimicrobium sp. CCC2.4]|uniref:hypothetical protein n=1 Tax=Actimicrobium sp. CCC2.4 TaxID=3048606 RepID=UPI002AC8D3F3|nr:hypothetical protein [Actimicrobium sp. CCC2.4]MEB0136930.1 hypothetical protein [Actimicrobium sp. CCC2.4]WPX32707.1 hypothetical protein RHM62_02310 [Actimicrobium sp. CCC2.4]